MADAVLGKEVLLGEDIVGMFTFGGYPASQGCCCQLGQMSLSCWGKGLALAARVAVLWGCPAAARPVLCCVPGQMRT